ANDNDCDDSNGGINPAATEVCNGVDDDCDGDIDESGAAATWYADADGDTYGDPLVSQMACAAPMGYVANDDDCDDSNGGINPAATEVCNGVDDDCDGSTDEGVQLTFYADTDGDTYGDPLVSQMACAAPMGYVANDNDCDDSNGGINPAATEVCNGVDDDCDGFMDTADPGLLDNTLPTVSCQNITVQLGTNGTVSINAAQVSAGASDNCGSPTLSVSPNSFTCANFGANTVTLTATDFVGNTATCNATVTVQDIAPPTAMCQNLTVPLDASGNASITAFQVDNGSFDNCAVGPISIDQSSFDCNDLGANTVTLTVPDVFGNISTCTATITVQDVAPPSVSCQNITVPLNATGTATIQPNDVITAISDNCGTVSGTLSTSNFNCANIGTNTVIVTATDGSNNSATCSATVTIVDNTPPTVNCQNITVPLDAFGNAIITPAQVSAGASDNCGTPTLSLSNTSFSCANIGANTVVLTATAGSLTASCSATVTIVDIAPPMVNCQNITVPLNAAGTATITPAQVSAGTSDNCGTPTLSLNITNFSCANIGANTVILTATAGSLTATCSATVNIVDNTPPTAICQNLTVALDANGTASIAPAQVNNGSSDACGLGSLSLNQSSFNCGNVGANTVTLSVPDANGNTATCTATITVQDLIPPSASCQNITVALGANGTVSITPAQVNNGSSDNCGTPSLSLNISSFGCANIGVNTVVLTATDAGGSTSTCTSSVTVQDNTPPTALCKNAIAVLDASGSASIVASDVDNSSFDNCVSPVLLSLSQSSFNCSNIGTNTVVLTVTAGSQTSTCTAIVTVQDNTPPTVNCQNITVPLDALGNAVITPAQVSAGASDNCGAPSLSLNISNFSCANIGANTVILTATAGNLTASCSATVTVVDNLPPTANCQNVTAPLNTSGTAIITPAQVNNGSSDNCGLGSLSLNQSSFNCANIGTPVSVTLSVPDVNGNTATCPTTVTVIDNLPPTALCQNIIISLDVNGTASIAPGDVNNGSFDNCGVPTLSLSQSSFNCSNLGLNNVTLTATDASNNSSNCAATVTVNSILTVNAGTDVSLCSGNNTQLYATASGAASYSYSWSPTTSLSNANIADPVASPNSTTTYTVTISANGCSATDQVTVSVAPAPVATVSSNSPVCEGSTITLLETGGSPGITWVWSGPNNFSSTLQNPTIPNASALNAGQYSVTVSNGSSCSATAATTVSVNTLPTANAGTDQSICAGATAQLQATGGTGFLWSPAASLSDPAIANPVASPSATTTYTVTVTNGNNCTVTDAVVVTVAPQPTISGVLANCDANMTTYTVNLNTNASQLLASAGTVVNNGGGAWTVSGVPTGTNLTLTATDGGGCSASQQVASPNCSCPAVAAPVAVGNAITEICEGLSNPVFAVTVGAGETADWYDAAAGGTLLASGALSFTPSQSAPGIYNFYAETRVIANGCLSTVRTQFSLAILQNPVANAGNDVNICAGASVQLNGAASNSANGALTYAWSPATSLNDPNLASPTASPSLPTTYALTVTDPKGCTDEAMVNVNISTVSPPVAGANQAICAGATIPSLTVSVNAGETADWYSAAIGGALLAQGTTSYTPTTAGTFYVETRLLAGGCTSASRVPISLTINPLPIASATAGIPVCAGSNVQLDASTSLGAAPLSFVWNNGATIANPTVTPASTTTYTVTVTDGNGCSATAQTIAIVNANPSLTLGTAACDANLINFSFTVSLSGGDQLSTTAGTITGGGTSYSVAAPSGQNLQLTATNSFTGCTTQQDVTGLVCGCPTTLAPVSGGDKVICEGIPTPTLSVNVGTNQTADWYTQPSGGIAVATGTTSFTPSQTTSGIYTFYVETRYALNNSCLSAARTPIQLVINALPTANAGLDATICESETITLSGTGSGAGSLSYAWSPALLLSNGTIANPDFAAAAVGLQPFTLTVTDANGCSATDAVAVDVVAKPSLLINSPTCNGLSYSLTFTTNANQVAASAGILTGIIGSFTITDIPSLTDVTITVTNPTTGCSEQQTVTGIACNCAGLVGAPVSGGNQAVCAGATLPALTVTVGTGATANWYDSAVGGSLLAANTTSYTPTAAGTYYAEAVNATLGCVSDFRTPLVLTINPLPTAVITPSGATTFCEGNTVDLTASGGTGFLWSTGETSATIAASTSNDYAVTVTGTGGCTATASQSVTVNPNPAAAITGDNDLCLGENTVLTASGGTGYSWSTGVSVAATAVSPMADATYSVTVTDGNGCSDTESINVMVHALPTASVANSGSGTIFCTNTNGVQLNASGTGQGPFSFVWSPTAGLNDPNIANPVASPTTLVPYTVTVTDANGCSSSGTVLVFLQDAPILQLTSNSPICANEDLELTETGGQAVQWSWTGPGGFSSNEQSPVLAQADVLEGTYSLVGTDASGCSSTTDLEVALSAGLAFEAKFLTTNVACEGDTLHFIEISATTELPDAFVWDFGDGNTSTERDPAHVYEMAGAYQVSVVVTEGGCDNFSIEKEVNINDCRATGGSNGLAYYKLYPTINSGRFELELELMERGLLRLDLQDISGRVIWSKTVKDVLTFSEKMEVAEPGVYFLKVQTLQGSKTLKVLVVRA
ncbi:MAG: hypothetical protein IT258_15480, partial [Saprospiraceae bacterium]|nr:hypothetical protein [Saprospiraceae bacterium]